MVPPLSTCATTVPASTWPTQPNCSSPSRGCIRRAHFPGTASGWRRCGASSSTTAAVSGHRARSTSAPPSSSPCPASPRHANATSSAAAPPHWTTATAAPPRSDPISKPDPDLTGEKKPCISKALGKRCPIQGTVDPAPPVRQCRPLGGDGRSPAQGGPPSPHVQTTVHREVGACGVATFFAGEPGDDGGDFARLVQALDRHRGDDFFQHVGTDGVDHVGAD